MSPFRDSEPELLADVGDALDLGNCIQQSCRCRKASGVTGGVGRALGRAWRAVPPGDHHVRVFGLSEARGRQESSGDQGEKNPTLLFIDPT